MIITATRGVIITRSKLQTMKLAGAYIPDEKHEALRQLAKQNHRTLADQCRHIFDLALAGKLKVKYQNAQKEQKR